MIPKPVSDPVAHGAVALGGSNREAETQAEKDPVEVGLESKTQGLGGAGLKPSAGTGCNKRMCVRAASPSPGQRTAAAV